MAAALAHLAHARAAAATGAGGALNTAAYTQLATKLESLIHTCLQPNILPDIARRVGCHQSSVINHHQSGVCIIIVIASHKTETHMIISQALQTLVPNLPAASVIHMGIR